MRRLFKVEMIKATKNKMFAMSLLIGTVLCIYSAIYVIVAYYGDLENMRIMIENSDCLINPMTEAFSFYNKWIGQEWISVASSLFFLLLPLSASLPYSRSYCTEKKSGYINSIFIRVSRAKYIKIKFAVTFLVGALCVLIPLLINVMIVSSFIPAVRPDVFYDMYYNMPVSCVLSVLFYKTPLLYTITKLIIISAYAGAFATLGQAVGTVIRNKFVVVLFPFIFMLLFNYVSNVFSSQTELSPIQFLYGGGDVLLSHLIVPLELFVLISGSFLIMKIRGGRKDVL